MRRKAQSRKLRVRAGFSTPQPPTTLGTLAGVESVLRPVPTRVTERVAPTVEGSPPCHSAARLGGGAVSIAARDGSCSCPRCTAAAEHTRSAKKQSARPSEYALNSSPARRHE